MDHVKIDEEKVWCARKRAATNVWVGWSVSIVWLEDVESVRIPKKGGLILLTGMYIMRNIERNESLDGAE